MTEMPSPQSKIQTPIEGNGAKFQIQLSHGFSTTVGLSTSNEQTSLHQSAILKQHAKEPFMKKLCRSLCPPENNYGSRYAPIVPPPKHIKKGKKTLVLDMDETILRCELAPFPTAKYSTIVRYNNKEVRCHFAYRPGLESFLEEMSKEFEIAIYTISSQKYAEPLLRGLKEYVDLILHRDHCSVVDGDLKKDLRVLRRDLKDVIMVENSTKQILQPENTIVIQGYTENQEDRQLDLLSEFLKFAKELKDVRPMESYVVLYTQGIPFSYIDMKGRNQTSNGIKDTENLPFLEKVPIRKTFIPIKEQPEENPEDLEDGKEDRDENNNCRFQGDMDEIPADEHPERNIQDIKIKF